MTDREFKRLNRLGYEKLRTPMLYLINITYGIFANSKSDNKFTESDYNTLFTKIIIRHHPKFIFYDKTTNKLFNMGLEHVVIDKMIPRDNLNIFQQDNYEISGDVDMCVWHETDMDEELYNWYKSERNKFKRRVDEETLSATAMDEFGDLIPVGLDVAENITKDDFCVFQNIMETLPIIEEFIMFSLSRNATYRCLGSDKNSWYFTQEEMFWASLITNDSISRIADGFRTIDIENEESRVMVLKAFTDFHTRPLNSNELNEITIKSGDKLVAVDKGTEPTFKCLTVGVLTISNNMM